MPIGFIKTPLEIMELILYILARTDGAIDMPALTDLALCDEGVDYFQFSDALGKLVETGHVSVDGQGKYAITPKGLANGKTTEEELPYSVRVRCDKNVAELNRRLQRERLVRTETVPRGDGMGYTVRLVLDDESGNVMTLELLAPDQTQAAILCDRFHARPERLYNAVLTQLLEQKED